jgi:malyl-CoA/(S)-citramalyl-CoA lyase
VLGCEGTWAIHPSQIDLSNDAFSPSVEAIAQTEAILDAMEEAQKQGRGAVTLDGKLIDIASINQAKVLVDTAAQIAEH